jgi:hypothetical protein
MSERIKPVASEYWKLGCNIVLLKQKKPLHEWQKWINERQTEQEFNDLSWTEATQIAVICGTKLDNGLFFCAVDFDVKNLPAETVEKGRQAHRKLPITRIEGTPSKGMHYLYLRKTKPKTVSAFHNQAALELLGEGKLCISWPSPDYSRLNDNDLTTVQDLESLFYEALSSVGIKAEKKTQSWFDRQDLAVKPYRKDDPPCIRQIKKGVEEGIRNEATVRLSSYLVNFRQLEPKRAFQELLFFNRLNRPPLQEDELRSVFESTIKNGYIFGCQDDILKSYCKEHFECPLRKKDEEKKTEKTAFDPETESRIDTEVNEILDADNQLEALTPHLDSMVVGEVNTKKAIVPLVLSGKSPNPKMKQIIILKSTEGAGKSTVMVILTEGYKVKDVGRFSEHALDYANLEGFEILRLKELGSMDEEKQGLSTIKFLSSDDQGYNVEVTVKNEETGKFETQQYRIPPITTISSTVRLTLDAQFERRAWLFGMDETPDQTKRIREWKAQRERQEGQKLLGLRKITNFEFSREVYRRFIQKFQPKEVIIPFPASLLEILGCDVLRVRGDMDKLLNFVKLYAMLNVKRLEEIRENVFLLSPEVAYEAIQIIQEPLAEMLSKVDSRTKQLFGVLGSIVEVQEEVIVNQSGSTEKHEVEVRYNHKGAKISKAVREKMAIITGKSERTIRSYFSALESSGYASSDTRKPKTFTLLYDISEIQKKLIGTLAKPESANDLMCKMQKEAQEWCKTTSEIFPSVDGLNVEQQQPISDTEVSLHTSLSTDKRISDPSLQPFQTALAEPTLENRQIQKQPIAQQEKTSESKPVKPDTHNEAATRIGLIPCPYCQSQGKDMFFATDHDLRGHISSHHTSSEPEAGR